jgi:hypothetical protein
MNEPMILVGFGKHDLVDLWANKDTSEGEQILMEAIPVKHWPPRYRRVSICTPEEVRVFQEYLRWMLGYMAQTEEEVEDDIDNRS